VATHMPRYGGTVFDDILTFLEQVSGFSTVEASYPQFYAIYPQIRIRLRSLLLPLPPHI
jgi:hypothetical protein